MNRLVRELRDFKAKARVFCLIVIALTFVVLFKAGAYLAYASLQDQALLLLFAIVVSILSSNPSRFPGTKTVVSVSESIVFLAAILQGPYSAAILGLVDAVGLSRKLAKKRIYILINASVLTLSAFASAHVYHYGQAHLYSGSPGALPDFLKIALLSLAGMALTHYVVNLGLTALFSHLLGACRFIDTWREAFPWIPVTYLAGASAAGLTAYALTISAVAIALLLMTLALPIPVIIYYTFKTYNSKLEDERRHIDELNEIHRSTLEALAMAIDAKDQTTHKHIRRVQIYALRLGEMMQMDGNELKALEAASLLHDIGKLGVPDYILNKPGKLTEYEFNKMKVHPVIGAEILSNVKFDFPVATYVRAHHERWDGCGYPDGLKGEEIPLGARILALVDHFDALHSDRPYRKALTREDAINHIKDLSGSFFDPALVELFLGHLGSLDAEIEAIANFEPHLPTLSSAVLGNKSAPAAGYAEEHRPLTEVALDKIAAAHQEVATLHDIARVLSSTLSLQDTVAIITSRIANLVPYTTCVIYLLDSSEMVVRAEYASGLYMEMFRGRQLRLGEGITGWVVANDRPMYNTSPLLDLSFLGCERAERFKSVVVFPVLKNGEAFGALALYSMELHQYTEEHLRLLDMTMQPVSDALHNALLFENARQTALTDSLTGLPNMRAFSVYFEHEANSGVRSQHPLSILVVDLNDFKQINDNYGHIVGDRVLLHFAQLLNRQLRADDIVARYAGDEFVALLPMTDPEQAGFVIERIQNAISNFFYETADGKQVKVTASIGAATIPVDGQTFEELMMQADRRMYRSKDDVKSRLRSSGFLQPVPGKKARAS
jgi:diguanylate cyclase (GGDEF)-like protein/putative nucleotidyltransferase with HDIG domain